MVTLRAGLLARTSARRPGDDGVPAVRVDAGVAFVEPFGDESASGCGEVRCNLAQEGVQQRRKAVGILVAGNNVVRVQDDRKSGGERGIHGRIKAGEPLIGNTAMNELWYQQMFGASGWDLRVGQMAADTEFLVSTYGAVFINSGFGWPTLPAVNLPSGGNAYPLATPGVRVHAAISESIGARVGIYNGDPAGPGATNPQARDASGTLFRTSDGVFAIAELQYVINQDAKAEGLPGSYKLGGWYNSNNFADQRFAANGVVLANPLAAGGAKQRRGTFSFYALVDQAVTKEGVGIFARVMGTPDDRNALDFFVNGGLTVTGAIAGRDDDTLGIGLIFSRIGRRAQLADQDAAFFAGGSRPIRSSETVLELTYQAQVAGWWQIQPDLQFIANPGGGLASPGNPTKRLGNAVMLGLRSMLTF